MAGESGPSRKRGTAGALASVWRKISEDWVFNFSGMLAFSYLIATAPLLLVALAIGGLALDTIAPDTLTAYIQALASQLPAGGEQLVVGAVDSLRSGAGLLLAIAIVAAIIAGSRLFIALENCFSVIYRLGERRILPQYVRATLMTLLYAVLAPLAFVASGQLSGLVQFLIAPLAAVASDQLSGIFSYMAVASATPQSVITYLEGLIVGIFIAFILFYAMYLFVPNRQVVWRRDLTITWRGALAAAVLLTLFEQLFPLYQSLFLRSAGYSSVAGLAIIAVIFLYVVGFITLLGAEINAWYEGLRPLGVTLPEIYRERNGKRA